MKRLLAMFAAILFSACYTTPRSLSERTASRERINFDADWYFTNSEEQLQEGPIRSDQSAPIPFSGNPFRSIPLAAKPDRSPLQVPPAAEPGYDTTAWRKLTLPHDWAIEGSFDQKLPGETGKLPFAGVAWYHKQFTLEPADAGKHIELCIDGAMSHASVWLNNKLLGGWPYGYASWQIDVTPALNYGGPNTLDIRLDNPDKSSRWYPGAGIYRHVWLEKTNPVHVAQWGTFIATKQYSERNAVVRAQVWLQNETASPRMVEVQTSIFKFRGKSPVCAGETQIVTIPANGTTSCTQEINIPMPELWGLTNPTMYKAVTQVSMPSTLPGHGTPLDDYTTPFGIRTAEFTVNDGFHLNGRRVPLNGVCLHHDLGALGAVTNRSVLAARLKLLKEMGCNAIRTSHNPPSPELVELCDQMGFLLMAEGFDMWKGRKKPNDYHLLFDDWAEADIRSLVRHYRNSPSIILWSIGNEIAEQAKPEAVERAARLTRFVHMEDPTRPTTIACSNTKAIDTGLQHSVNVFGTNYGSTDYSKFIAQNPGQPYFSSESSSAVSSRGSYFFDDYTDPAAGQIDYQVDSNDLRHPKWATTPDWEFEQLDRHPSMAGEFVWTGFDYLGEPTPYNADLTNLLNYTKPEDKARAQEELDKLGKVQVPSRSSYFGIIDLAGFPKDRFWLYQARWRPDLPMAHLSPHWTWPGREGKITPVQLYTSGDSAELFLNGRSLGKKTKGQYEYRLRWDDVAYQPGELKAIAYKDGVKWAEETVRTAGPAAKIQLESTPAPGNAPRSPDDLAIVTVAITDAHGNLVPNAGNAITFALTSPGKVVATDNGDATSHASFQSPTIKAFNGRCMALLRIGSKSPGILDVVATGENLPAAKLRIK